MTFEFLLSEIHKKNNDITKILKGLDIQIIKNDPNISKITIQMLHDSLKNWKNFNDYLIELLKEQETK